MVFDWSSWRLRVGEAIIYVLAKMSFELPICTDFEDKQRTDVLIRTEQLALYCIVLMMFGWFAT